MLGLFVTKLISSKAEAAASVGNVSERMGVDGGVDTLETSSRGSSVNSSMSADIELDCLIDPVPPTAASCALKIPASSCKFLTLLRKDHQHLKELLEMIAQCNVNSSFLI